MGFLLGWGRDGGGEETPAVAPLGSVDCGKSGAV
jgi:hypothetical protein